MFTERLVRRHPLLEGMSYRRSYLTRVHVLQEDLSYWIICLTVGQCLPEDRSYWRVCLIGIGSHVLDEEMSYRWTYLARVHEL